MKDLYCATMASTASSKCFLRGKGQELTYGDVDASVRKLTTLFEERGLETGDYILLNTRDDARLAVLYLACVVNGLAAVITDPSMPSLEKLATLVQPRLGFVDKENLESALPDPGFEVIPLDEPRRKTRALFKKLLNKGDTSDDPQSGAPLYTSLLESTEPFEGDFPGVDPNTTALVLFTSGTTSEPKGVELTQKNMLAQMRILLERLNVDDKSQIFNILPFHHTDGITNGVTLALAGKATLHRPGVFTIHDLPNMLDYLYREGISHLITVPTVLALMDRLGEDYTDIFQSGDFKILLSSAGVLAPDLWQSFEDRFRVRICNGYGLTETVSVCTLSGPDDESFRVGSVGLPLASEIRIVDERDSQVPPGEEGELLVRGDLVMKGYVNNPAATAAVFSGDWLHTGDSARIAEDGKVEILGRKKNIIVRGGINVHPEEITSVALEHSSVVHAAAYGAPEPIWGEVAVLCIVEDIESGLSVDELSAFLRGRLASERMPAEIHKFADFPRGPAGKVVLPELQEQVALRKARNDGEADGDTLDVVVRIGASLLKVPRDALAPSSSAENVSGWDSLFHLNFILSVEEAFVLEFLPREIMAVRTLGDLADLADKHRDRKAVSTTAASAAGGESA